MKELTRKIDKSTYILFFSKRYIDIISGAWDKKRKMKLQEENPKLFIGARIKIFLCLVGKHNFTDGNYQRGIPVWKYSGYTIRE